MGTPVRSFIDGRAKGVSEKMLIHRATSAHNQLAFHRMDPDAGPAGEQAMNVDNFHDSMLNATFAFARLALSQVVLLNGAGATALLAFMSSHDSVGGGMRCAVVLFAIGAGLGVFATVLAYFGQRCNWESINAKPDKYLRRAFTFILGAMIAALASLVLFVVAVWRASSGI